MNPLTDLIPAKYRKYMYAVAAILGVLLAAYTASNGDWKAFAISLASTLISSLAHANTSGD